MRETFEIFLAWGQQMATLFPVTSAHLPSDLALLVLFGKGSVESSDKMAWPWLSVSSSLLLPVASGNLNILGHNLELYY